MTNDLFVDDLIPGGAGVKIHLPDSQVEYFPSFFAQNEANELLSILKSEIQWQQEKIKLYGQVYDLPRQTAWYGEPGKTYVYSGITVHSLPWIEPLLLIKKRIEAISKASFNSVLLNLYRNGLDSVSWHADDEPELGSNPIIGSVSFGERRPFHMKHKTRSEKTSIVLEHGSFLLMGGATQHHWLHQIPKSKRAMSERINLTFRRIV